MRGITIRRLVVVVVLALMVLAPRTALAGGLAQFDWLVGTWKRERADWTVYESWRVLSDRTMEGESYVVSKKSGEKRLTESLLLAELGPDVYYIPRPMENAYPVPFRMVEADAGKAVFENPLHDFPQHITYERNDEDSLTATAEGPGPDGETRSLVFAFQRAD
jgi:hypothetical protein